MYHRLLHHGPGISINGVSTIGPLSQKTRRSSRLPSAPASLRSLLAKLSGARTMTLSAPTGPRASPSPKVTLSDGLDREAAGAAKQVVSPCCQKCHSRLRRYGCRICLVDKGTIPRSLRPSPTPPPGDSPSLSCALQVAGCANLLLPVRQVLLTRRRESAGAGSWVAKCGDRLMSRDETQPRGRPLDYLTSWGVLTGCAVLLATVSVSVWVCFRVWRTGERRVLSKIRNAASDWDSQCVVGPIVCILNKRSWHGFFFTWQGSRRTLREVLVVILANTIVFDQVVRHSVDFQLMASISL